MPGSWLAGGREGLEAEISATSDVADVLVGNGKSDTFTVSSYFVTAIEVDGVVQTVGYPFTLANVTVKTAFRFTIAPGVITVSPGKDCATNAAVVRTGRFLPDLAIYTGSALPSDYTHSGFDRRHLAPAGDMRFDALAMLESFSMANTSPQFPAFNRGVWKRLEEHVRTLAVRRRSCVVVTGLIFIRLEVSSALRQ